MGEIKVSKHQTLTRMRELGVTPATVFDVGVAMGTSGFYGIFEDVRYVMVEPLKESLPFMQELAEKYPGSVMINAAAGSKPGEQTFVVDPAFSGSSFLLSEKAGELRTVPIVTLDGVAREHGLSGPYVIKLDVQGFELEVLAGAEEVLKDTQAVIAEASLWADLKGRGMATFTGLVNWFDARGFVLYDIAGLVRRKLDGAISELDLVFCPADSPLRKVKTYKSPEDTAAKIEERRRRFGLA